MIAPETHLTYAAGYLALNLTAEARGELALLPEKISDSMPALSLGLEIAMQESAWDEVIALAPKVVALDSSLERPWISWAYALREQNRITEAQETLLTGARLIKKPSPVVNYNLACYACLLGELEEARQLLESVFVRDKSWRPIAREDEDLAALFPGKK